MGKLLEAGRTLAAGLTDTGFGHPFLATHFITRVEAKALAGAECLASACKGMKGSMADLNAAQYTVAKGFLGVPRHVSMGSRAAVLAETRLLTRTGTALVVRVVMARARVVCLPLCHPAHLVMQAIVSQHISGTWWEHSAAVVREWLGDRGELWQLGPIPEAVRFSAVARRKFLTKYRRKVVVPRVRAAELEWFRRELSKLRGGLVPYSGLAPPLRPWRVAVRRARWGRVMWRLFRAWSVARVTGEIPVVVWTGTSIGKVAAQCLLCGNVCIGLKHLLVDCIGCGDLRQEAAAPGVDSVLQWALRGENDMALLAAKVKFVGLCAARFVKAMARGQVEVRVDS